DDLVTGVQTCALPISWWTPSSSDSGTSVTNLVSTTVPMPCTVAFTPPLRSVVTALTYFVICEAVRISQPQPLTVGGVVGPDWNRSEERRVGEEWRWR